MNFNEYLFYSGTGGSQELISIRLSLNPEVYPYYYRYSCTVCTIEIYTPEFGHYFKFLCWKYCILFLDAIASPEETHVDLRSVGYHF